MKPTNPSAWRRRNVLAAAVCALAAPAIRAQAWPAKPIRLVVPYPPGGGTDIVARLLAQKLSTSLGQQVLVDNKPGASTIIGTDLVAKAAPDGYTVGLITDSHAINPTFFPKLPYDSVKDFAPISQLVFVPLMMVAHPSLNVKTLRDFIALAKSQPGRINYASIGNGTPHHLSMEWLRSLAGIDITHVPYKGVAPALTDLVGGQVQVMFTGTSSAAPYVKDGRLVPLAVSTGKRQAAFPDVPAARELLPDFDFVTWYGVVAPAGTPRDAIRLLSREIGAALALPDVKDRLSGMGVEGAASTPEQFASFVNAQASHLQKLVRLTGVKPE
jgi:tripartite-type tricarboxylate transporter receptor subunit TctC